MLDFRGKLSKNFSDQPFALKRDIMSDFRCFHPSHTSIDRKSRRCESTTRNDVEAVAMAMKTMNLAKLPVWMILVIHLFHLGAGKCSEELIFVTSNSVYEYKLHK